MVTAKAPTQEEPVIDVPSDDSFNFEECFEKALGIRLDPKTLEPIADDKEEYERFESEL